MITLLFYQISIAQSVRLSDDGKEVSMPRQTYSWLRNKSLNCDTLIQDLIVDNKVKDSLYKTQSLKTKACFTMLAQKDSSNVFLHKELDFTKNLLKPEKSKTSFLSYLKSPIPWISFTAGSLFTLFIIKR